MRIFNLVVNNYDKGSKDQSQIVGFALEEWVGNPEAEFRSAINEFFQTQKGFDAILESCMDYNWGDFLDSIPTAFLREKGFFLLENRSTNISVNHQEILCKNTEIPFSLSNVNGELYIQGGENISIPLNLSLDQNSVNELTTQLHDILGNNLICTDVDEIKEVLINDFGAKILNK